MRRLALAALFLAGCGAPPLTAAQRDALVRRVRDLGDVAANAVVARDAARDDVARAAGKTPAGADLATLAFVASETALLASDVAASVR